MKLIGKGRIQTEALVFVKNITTSEVVQYENAEWNYFQVQCRVS